MLRRVNKKKQKSWRFQGSFEVYQEPDMLHALIKRMITGSKTALNFHNGQTHLDKTVNDVT